MSGEEDPASSWMVGIPSSSTDDNNISLSGGSSEPLPSITSNNSPSSSTQLHSHPQSSQSTSKFSSQPSRLSRHGSKVSRTSTASSSSEAITDWSSALSWTTPLEPHNTNTNIDNPPLSPLASSLNSTLNSTASPLSSFNTSILEHSNPPSRPNSSSPSLSPSSGSAVRSPPVQRSKSTSSLLLSPSTHDALFYDWDSSSSTALQQPGTSLGPSRSTTPTTSPTSPALNKMRRRKLSVTFSEPTEGDMSETLADKIAETTSTPMQQSSRTMDRPPRRLGFLSRAQASERRLHRIQQSVMGVYIPSVISSFNALFWMRPGVVVGSGGLLGALLALYLGAVIGALTFVSISGLVSNMKRPHKGHGGWFYMILDVVGPEFGIVIGAAYASASLASSALTLVGLRDIILDRPSLMITSPEHALTVMFVCSSVLMASLWKSGHSLRTSFAILVPTSLALLSTLSSLAFQHPEYISGYTAPCWSSMRANFFPQLSQGSSHADTFTFVFPVLSGFTAGFSMSRNGFRSPGNAVSRGLLAASLTSVIINSALYILLAASFERPTLLAETDILAQIGFSQVYWLGAVASMAAAAMAYFLSASHTLHVLAREALFPALGFILARPGPEAATPTLVSSTSLTSLTSIDSSASSSAVSLQQPLLGSNPNGSPNSPRSSTLDAEMSAPSFRAHVVIWIPLTVLTWLLTLEGAAFLATSSLIFTYAFVNTAAATIAGAGVPNFRPRFTPSSWRQAATGGVLTTITLLLLVPWLTIGLVTFLSVAWVWLHWKGTPRAWGMLSQLILGHQVRKWLLALTKDRCKSSVQWRPSLLMITATPQSIATGNLVRFSNAMKKGGLLVIGHVIIADRMGPVASRKDGLELEWSETLANRSIRGFAEVMLAPSAAEGASLLMMSVGLGAMTPNTVCLGLDEWLDYPSNALWSVVQDAMALKKLILLARGFTNKSLARASRSPTPSSPTYTSSTVGDGGESSQGGPLSDPGSPSSVDASIRYDLTAATAMDQSRKAPHNSSRGLSVGASGRWIHVWSVVHPGASDEQHRPSWLLSLVYAWVLSQAPGWIGNTSIRLFSVVWDADNRNRASRRLTRLCQTARVDAQTVVIDGEKVIAPTWKAWRARERSVDPQISSTPIASASNVASQSLAADWIAMSVEGRAAVLAEIMAERTRFRVSEKQGGDFVVTIVNAPPFGVEATPSPGAGGGDDHMAWVKTLDSLTNQTGPVIAVMNPGLSLT